MQALQANMLVDHQGQEDVQPGPSSTGKKMQKKMTSFFKTNNQEVQCEEILRVGYKTPLFLTRDGKMLLCPSKRKMLSVSDFFELLQTPPFLLFLDKQISQVSVNLNEKKKIVAQHKQGGCTFIVLQKMPGSEIDPHETKVIVLPLA